MESLVTRLGETLQYTIWEHVLKILDRTAEYVSKCFNTIFFLINMLNILTLIFDCLICENKSFY